MSSLCQLISGAIRASNLIHGPMEASSPWSTICGAAEASNVTSHELINLHAYPLSAPLTWHRPWHTASHAALNLSPLSTATNTSTHTHHTDTEEMLVSLSKYRQYPRLKLSLVMTTEYQGRTTIGFPYSIEYKYRCSTIYFMANRSALLSDGCYWMCILDAYM